jgi:uncharacterized protein YlxW (UPF0749 family)
VNDLVTLWVPIGSLTMLAAGLVLKHAEQAHRIRLLERENAELRVKQVEAQQSNVHLQEQVSDLQTKLTNATAPTLPVAFPRHGRGTRALDG